jgi:large-conductance mechanosensitive channel
MDPESVDVTAGLEGFLAFFLLAVALYLLMRNMNARMRRMAYREEQDAKAADDGSDIVDPDSSGPQDGPDLG